jgi:hypothetical protein
VRLGREAGVGAVEVPRQREVLLHDDGAERDRRERRVVAERVVGEADGLAVALAKLREDVQPDALRRRGVLRRALEDGDVVAGGRDRGVELRPRRHAGGEQHRLAGRGHRAHELEVRHLAGPDLVAPDAQALEPLDCARGEDRAEELDARALARILERRPLLVGERGALEVLPAALVLEVRRRGCVARRLRLGVVQLELDGVDAALGGDLGHPDRVAQAPVVGHAGLRDDVDRSHPGDASFVP